MERNKVGRNGKGEGEGEEKGKGKGKAVVLHVAVCGGRFAIMQ